MKHLILFLLAIGTAHAAEPAAKPLALPYPVPPPQLEPCRGALSQRQAAIASALLSRTDIKGGDASAVADVEASLQNIAQGAPDPGCMRAEAAEAKLRTKP